MDRTVKMGRDRAIIRVFISEIILPKGFCLIKTKSEKKNAQIKSKTKQIHKRKATKTTENHIPGIHIISLCCGPVKNFNQFGGVHLDAWVS